MAFVVRMRFSLWVCFAQVRTQPSTKRGKTSRPRFQQADVASVEMRVPFFFFSAHFAGRHDLPDGAVLSVPVTFADGKWSALADVSVGDELKETLELSASEIRRVRQSRKSDAFKTHFHSSKTCCRRFDMLPFQKYF